MLYYNDVTFTKTDHKVRGGLRASAFIAADNVVDVVDDPAIPSRDTLHRVQLLDLNRAHARNTCGWFSRNAYEPTYEPLDYDVTNVELVASELWAMNRADDPHYRDEPPRY